MRKRRQPRRKASARRAPPRRGKASAYIDQAEIRPGMRFVLALRVSAGSQDRRNNIQDQEDTLWRIVEESGGRVVGTFRHTGSGTNPEWLREAAAHAHTMKAVLLAETVDRFVRPEAYHSKLCHDAQATDADLKLLRQVCGEVRLMTYVHPDASPREVKAYHTKRGQRAKGRKGGRPRAQKRGYKAEVQAQRMSDVLELCWVGDSVRKIAKLLQLFPTQVQRYVARLRAGEGCTHSLCKSKWFNDEFCKKSGTEPQM